MFFFSLFVIGEWAVFLSGMFPLEIRGWVDVVSFWFVGFCDNGWAMGCFWIFDSVLGREDCTCCRALFRRLWGCLSCTGQGLVQLGLRSVFPPIIVFFLKLKCGDCLIRCCFDLLVIVGEGLWRALSGFVTLSFCACAVSSVLVGRCL